MPKKPTFFQERKDFISRMLAKQPTGQYGREQKFAKDIFNKYPVKFLKGVPKPFENLTSLAYFISPDGKKYLDKKLNEYNYKPKRVEVIYGEKKEGEDKIINRKKGFREFLNE